MAKTGSQEPKHGTTNEYRKGCRCRECRKAQAAYMADYRLRTGITKNRRWAGDIRPVAKHGTRARYVSGCRCEDCSDANRTYQREYMRLTRAGIAVRSEWDD